MRLLLVEDNGPLAAAMRSAFGKRGWEITVASDGSAAVASYDMGPYDLVVIEWVLPSTGSSGIELCTHLRQRSTTVGLLFISDSSRVQDRLLAFDAGADDYLARPFELDELCARVAALGRRSALWPLPSSLVTTEGTTHYLECGPLRVDMATLRVTVDGEHVELSLRQLLMVVYLLRHQGRLVHESELREHVLRTTTVVPSSTIRNHVHQLREKLGPAKVLIQSVHGKGYCIIAPDVANADADAGRRLHAVRKSSAG